MNPPKQSEFLRVVAYTRVSTVGQVNGKEFGSLEKQLANAQELTSRQAVNGWRFTREYRDTAISGSDDDRPAIQELIAAAERREFDIVVVQFFDRLGRHAIFSLSLVQRLDKLGIKAYSSDGNLIDVSSPEGFMLTGFKAVLAEGALMTMTNATRRGIRTKASQGYHQSGFAGYGYDKVEGGKGNIRPSPVEAPHMKEAYERLAASELLAEIVADFKRRGIRTKGRMVKVGTPEERAIGGKFFRTDTLEKCIRNSGYRGMIRVRFDPNQKDIPAPVEMDPYGPEWGLYPGRHVPLVTDELWRKANAALDKRAKRQTAAPRKCDPEGHYLLQGLFRCGSCKCPMAPTYACNRSKKKFRYYRCHNVSVNSADTKCGVRTLPADLVHSAVLQFLARLMMRPDIIAATLEAVTASRGDQAGGHKRELKSVSVELADVRGSISKCVDAITDKFVPELLPDLQVRAKTLKNKESELLLRQDQLAELCRMAAAKFPSDTEVQAALLQFSEKVNHLTGKEQKEVVRLLVKDVAVDSVKVPAQKAGNAKRILSRLRFTIRLLLGSLAPECSAKTGTLPIDFTVEMPANRKLWRFRFVEPFEGIEVESEVGVKDTEESNAGQSVVAVHPLIQAAAWKQEMVGNPKLKQIELARRIGKTPSLVCQYLGLLNLDAHVRQVLVSNPNAEILRFFTPRKLLKLVRMPKATQLATFSAELKLAKSVAAQSRDDKQTA